jgi:hypothetical protein
VKQELFEMKPQTNHKKVTLKRLARTLGVGQPTDLRSVEDRRDELLARVLTVICPKQEPAVVLVRKP